MQTLKSQKLHIGFFGKTNTGKSSLINKISGQNSSIVSDIAGTTTDVVEKSMELLPIGPIVLIDTAGFDDTTDLGAKRVEKTCSVLKRCDIAVIVASSDELDNEEIQFINKFDELKIPYFVMVNKCDDIEKISVNSKDFIYTSAKNDENLVEKFKEKILEILPDDFINTPQIVSDLLDEKDVVILVTPIDKEAPKGRLILPQVQTIRDLLDGNCITLVVKESELKNALEALKTPPKLVITDSQAFKNVAEIVPENVCLTSFSILFARLKGDLKTFVECAKSIDKLKDNDKVLILESCTHHAIEDDIGKVKIPALLKKKTGKNLIIEHFSGHEFPDISKYSLIIHCGACMTNRREVLSRILMANKYNVPITNYGITISYCLGILSRAVQMFE